MPDNLNLLKPVAPGDPIRAPAWNAVVERINGGTRGQASGSGNAFGPFSAMGVGAPPIVYPVRMRDDLLYVKDENLQRDDDELRHGDLINPGGAIWGRVADVMVWNPVARVWTSADIEIVVDMTPSQWAGGDGAVKLFGREMPIDAGQLIYVYYDDSSGKYTPLSEYQVRHAITVDDGSGYPEDDTPVPNTYAIRFTDAKYLEAAGVQEPTVADKAEGVHAFVHNLAQTPEYLAAGANVWCYYLQGQWWTYIGASGTGGDGGGTVGVGGCGWVGALVETDCLLVTLVSATGRCGGDVEDFPAPSPAPAPAAPVRTVPRRRGSCRT